MYPVTASDFLSVRISHSRFHKYGLIIDLIIEFNP